MSPLREVRRSDKSRSRWARRKTRARREQLRVKLNAAQQATLGADLLRDLEPDTEPVEVRIEHGQLVVNNNYLHADGEWATYPEYHARR